MQIYVLYFTQIFSNLEYKSDGYVRTNGSCNELEYGIYLTHETEDTPTDAAWHMIISCNSAGTAVQIGIPLIAVPEIYVRACSSGNWMSWVKK